MKAVYFFSGTGRTQAVAAYFAEKLNVPIWNIEGKVTQNDLPSSVSVVVFPVYCQNIPRAVREFLPSLHSEYVVLIAVYGKMWHGNVLQEAQKLISGQVIAGVYLPTGHTYLRQPPNFPEDGLSLVLDRINAPRPAVIPRQRKNVFSNFFPGWRSRIGVTIQKKDSCNDCGLCTVQCPMHTMENGSPGKNCIRCLRCVTQCPVSALEFKLHPFLNWYLSIPRENAVKVYL